MNNLFFETYEYADEIIPFHYHLEDLQPTTLYYPNWHTDLEFLQCISGECLLTCGARDYRMKSGDFFIINSEVIHCTTTNGRCLYNCFIIQSDFCKSNGIDIERIHFDASLHDKKLFDSFDDTIRLYNAISNNPESHEPNLEKTTLRIKVLNLLIYLCKNFCTIKSGKSISYNMKSSEYTKKALSYISNNLSSNLSLDEISNYVNLSKYHLSRHFKKDTGKTIFELINILRCREAHKLLLNGRSVSEAASMSGFDNFSYFSRTYKKYIGVPPSKSSVKRQ